MMKVTLRELDRRVRQGFWAVLGEACGDMIAVKNTRGRKITLRLIPEREKYRYGRGYYR